MADLLTEALPGLVVLLIMLMRIGWIIDVLSRDALIRALREQLTFRDVEPSVGDER